MWYRSAYHFALLVDRILDWIADKFFKNKVKEQAEKIEHCNDREME